MKYDIIGDIHGQADKLKALLNALQYTDSGSSYRHPDPDRQVIFVGDLIDRGPRQLETVDIARRMVGEGQALAVMGNHEFNAIAWHTMDPDQKGEHLRVRSGALGAKNRSQHLAFLEEIEVDEISHKATIEWFMTLPLWLELPELRVVHACWHQQFMGELRPRLTADLRLTPSLMIEASRPGSMAFRNVEALLKGLEVPLPAGHEFHDKDGHLRRAIRIRWWDPLATSYQALGLLPEVDRLKLPNAPIETDLRSPYDGAKPLFFGHYWMTGTPKPLTPSIACVDYSAGKGGPLVAYCWEGETTLSDHKFVATLT